MNGYAQLVCGYVLIQIDVGFRSIVLFGSTGSMHVFSVDGTNPIACVSRYFLGLFGGNTTMGGFPSRGCH